jgi:DNA-binding MarR family transcriptional regulator
MTLHTPGLSQRALCATTGIEKSSMVLFVDLLEGNGWLRREPHPSDRRTHALYVTDPGMELLTQIGRKLSAVEARFLSELSEDKQRALGESLARLIGSAR